MPAILAARSPQPVTAAAYAPDPPANTQALAKRFYSLLRTGGFSHPVWLAELYKDARQIVAQVGKRGRTIVAVDPLYLEKPSQVTLDWFRFCLPDRLQTSYWAAAGVTAARDRRSRRRAVGSVGNPPLFRVVHTVHSRSAQI